MSEFNVDDQLSQIAEEVTKHGLNFCGATFTHEPTSEEFEITVSKKSGVKKLKAQLEQVTKERDELKATLERCVNRLDKEAGFTAEGNEARFILNPVNSPS